MFVRSASPIWYFPNLVGAQLDDSYYLFTLSNLFPYAPVPIYHDPDGLIPWTDPIQFVSNGTLPVDMFWDPNLVYRLEVRQGPTQADPLIYLIENYIPNGKGATPPIVVGSNIENQITNGQFFDIDFVSPLTISAAGTYDLAPGWSLILTGTGTMTVTQNINLSNAATSNNKLIPPYSLTFASTGWTSAILQQRLNNLGDPWAFDNVAMSLVGISNSGGPLQIVTQYLPQGEPVGQVIISDFLPITTYTQLQNSVLIPHSGNTNPNLGSYVDIQTFLPVNGSVTLSDFYIAPQAAPIQITYLQETIERQEDHLFHYYKDSILIQPKDSILTGWNFGLNPYQFYTTAQTTATAISTYVADQTILVQATASSVYTVKAGTNQYSGLAIGAVGASNKFALIQYVDPNLFNEYFDYNLSALVKAAIATTHSTNVQIKMRLIYRTGLPSTIGNTEPIASWAGTDPVFSSGWSFLTAINDPAYTLTGSFLDFPFNQFAIPNFNSSQTLGIVLYTVGNMNPAVSNDYIVFDKISLVPNDFAIEANPLTFDETLRRCQYYYETSYQTGAAIGTVTNAGLLVAPQHIVYVGGSQWSMPYGTFGHTFSVKKRDNPTMTIFSPSTMASGGSLRAIISNGATPDGSADISLSGGWNSGTGSQSGFYFTSANTAATVTTSAAYTANSILSGAYYYHFTASSLLGR